MTNKTDAIKQITEFANQMPGNGIHGIGIHAALLAMTQYWESHLAEGHGGEIIINDIDEMIRELASRRHELANRLGLPDRPGLHEVTTLAALKIAEEMQAVIIDAWNRWDQHDQEDAPSLGERLEIYAGVDLSTEISVDRSAPIHAGKDAANNLALLSAPVQRWDVMEGTTSPIEAEPTYQIALDYEHAEGRVHISMTPQGLSAEEAENTPQLSVCFEVDNGMPTAHVYADVLGELAMTAYGMPGGVLGYRHGSAPTSRELPGQSPHVEDAAQAIAQAQEKSESTDYERPAHR